MHRLERFSGRAYLAMGVFLVAGTALAACGDDRNREPTASIEVLTESPVVGDWVEVDGAKSSDPDGDPLAYHWSLKAPAGSEGKLENATRKKAQFLADIAGDYTISLVVDDGEYKSETASVKVSVGDGNGPIEPDVVDPPDGEDGRDVIEEPDATEEPDAQEPPDTSEPTEPTEPTDPRAPVANAGADQEGSVGQRVLLDGSATTSPVKDADELSYFWRIVEKPEGSGALAIEGALTPHAWFVPDAAGVYKVRLDVRDGNLLSSDTTTITVTRDASSACLMVSRYIHYVTGHNKALGIYNCGDQTLDLSKYVLCLVTNDATSCTQNTNLARGAQDGGKSELGAGEVLTICAASIDDAIKPQCDLLSGSNLNSLTGDDRFFIYEDTDGNNTFTGVDLLIDAFGQTRTRPSSEIWKGSAFKRCNFDLYDGTSPFNEEDYYQVEQLSSSDTLVDVFSDLGAVPTEGC